MPKLVCCSCQCEFKPHVNGTYVVEMADFGPYKIWNSDTWKCPGCGIEVVSGFALHPVMEHYQAGFKDCLAKVEVTARRIVYDYERPQE